MLAAALCLRRDLGSFCEKGCEECCEGTEHGKGVGNDSHSPNVLLLHRVRRSLIRRLQVQEVYRDYTT